MCLETEWSQTPTFVHDLVPSIGWRTQSGLRTQVTLCTQPSITLSLSICEMEGLALPHRGRICEDHELTHEKRYGPIWHRTCTY